MFPQPSIGPTFELARPDLEMETLQRDLSAPASLSLLHRPLALLGGGEVENSGESGVGLVGPMCGEASVSGGGGGEGGWIVDEAVWRQSRVDFCHPQGSRKF